MYEDIRRHYKNAIENSQHKMVACIGDINNEIERSRLILSILIFAALAEPDKLTVVLPFQSKAITFNIEIRKQQLEKFKDLIKQEISASIHFDKFIPNSRVGRHIAKGSDIYETIIRNTSPDRGWQVCLSPPQYSTLVVIPDNLIAKINTYVMSQGIRMYTHLKYMNIANPTEKYIDNFIYELQVSNSMGFRGAVIHIGSSEDTEAGKKRALASIVEIGKHATEQCPLLLETCARERNDLFWSIDDFCDLYSRATDIVGKDKIKVCVDTCHVFAANYNPLFFMKHLMKMFGQGVVRLIHFNDSKKPKGCCVDRHEYPGSGYAGPFIMTRIMGFATENNIDMVMEL
jgi:deoxyribonuclease-4